MKLNIRVLLVFVFPFLYPVCGIGQNTLLFKIEHPKWKTESYVFGTMHVNESRAFQFGNPVFDALESCQVAAFELDLSHWSRQGIRSDIANDSNFRTALERIKTEFPKKIKEAGIQESDLMVKGGAVYTEILKKMTNPAEGEESRMDPMDIFFQSYATRKGIEVVGIETVQEQLKYLLNFNLDEAMDSAVGFLKTPDWDSKLLKYVTSNNTIQMVYEKMALDAICDEVYKMTITPWLNDLIYKRNAIMVERVYPLLSTQSVFMAVGAAHLCGEQGILNLLKQKGCKVTPVKIGGKTDAPELNWIMNELPGGALVETPNVTMKANDEDIEVTVRDGYDFSFSASDTARIGLVHFEISKSVYSDAIAPAEEGMVEPVDPIDIGTNEEKNVPYGEDHVGDAVFERYEDTSEHSNNDFAEMIASKWGDALKGMAVDTLHLQGRMGAIEVMKHRKNGFQTFWATFTVDEKSSQTWTLEAYGDPDWMNNPEILRFFTSFYLKP